MWLNALAFLFDNWTIWNHTLSFPYSWLVTSKYSENDHKILRPFANKPPAVGHIKLPSIMTLGYLSKRCNLTSVQKAQDTPRRVAKPMAIISGCISRRASINCPTFQPRRPSWQYPYTSSLSLKRSHMQCLDQSQQFLWAVQLVISRVGMSSSPRSCYKWG